VQIDVRLDDVVLRALEKEPEQRYQHASALKTEVETIVTSPRAPGQAANDAKPRQTERMLVAIAAAVVVLATGGLFVTRLVRPPASSREDSSVVSAANPAGSTSARVENSASRFREAELPPPASVRQNPPRANAAPEPDPESMTQTREARRDSQAKSEPPPRHEAVVTPPVPAERTAYALTRDATDFDVMESNPEILRLQLRQAEREKDDAHARRSVGVASDAEVLNANERVDLLRARLAGDRRKFAQVKIETAMRRLDAITARHQAGIARDVDVQRAALELEVAQARLIALEWSEKAAENRR
jgi:hypothetical protein